MEDKVYGQETKHGVDFVPPYSLDQVLEFSENRSKLNQTKYLSSPKQMHVAWLRWDSTLHSGDFYLLLVLHFGQVAKVCSNETGNTVDNKPEDCVTHSSSNGSWH